MGAVHYIAHSNEFWIKNLPEFKEGLKNRVGGEWESDVSYDYSDYKRRSKRAQISVSSDDFGQHLYIKKGDDKDVLDFFEYIKLHIAEGETCIIHLVSYEHARDMCIRKHIITSEQIVEEILLEN